MLFALSMYRRMLKTILAQKNGEEKTKTWRALQARAAWRRSFHTSCTSRRRRGAEDRETVRPRWRRKNLIS